MMSRTEYNSQLEAQAPKVSCRIINECYRLGIPVGIAAKLLTLYAIKPEVLVVSHDGKVSRVIGPFDSPAASLDHFSREVQKDGMEGQNFSLIIPERSQDVWEALVDLTENPLGLTDRRRQEIQQLYWYAKLRRLRSLPTVTVADYIANGQAVAGLLVNLGNGKVGRVHDYDAEIDKVYLELGDDPNLPVNLWNSTPYNPKDLFIVP